MPTTKASIARSTQVEDHNAEQRYMYVFVKVPNGQKSTSMLDFIHQDHYVYIDLMAEDMGKVPMVGV